MLVSVFRRLKDKAAVQPWHDVPIPDSAVDRVLSLSGLERSEVEGMRFLDFGCGSGRYLDAFAKAFPREGMVGVDTDLEGLAVAEKKGFHVLPLKGEDAKLPFEDGAFDFVFTSNVIEHIPYPVYLQYVEELSRVTKAGGRIFVGAPNYPFKRIYDMKTAVFAKKGYKFYYFFDDPTHCNCQNVLTVERQFGQHFSEVKFYATELFFDRFLRFLRRPYLQNKFRVLGYKFVGVCIK